MNTKKIKKLCDELDKARIPLDETVKIGLAVQYFPQAADNAVKNVEGSLLETATRKVFHALGDYRVAELLLQQKEINRIEEEIKLEASK